MKEELAATIKEPLNIYFDKNPHDGLPIAIGIETHNVDKSLEGKLKCLIFMPIISQTYCCYAKAPASRTAYAKSSPVIIEI